MTTTTAPAPVRWWSGGKARAVAHPVGVVWVGVVCFSLGPVLVAGASISGVAFSFWRLWAGVVILGAVAIVRRRHGVAAPITRRGAFWSIASGVAFGLHQLLFMTAIKVTSVVDVTLMNTLAPIIVGLLAVPLLGERPGPRFALWSALAMIGAAGVVVAGGAGPSGNPLGMAIAAANVVFYAFYFLGSKLSLPHIEPADFLFGVVVTAAIQVSIFVLVFQDAVVPVSAADLMAVVAVALVPGAVGHFSITWALRSVPANLPPVIMLTMPALSGALAWLLLDQTVTLLQVGAGLWTLVAVAGAVRSPAGSGPGHLRMDEALALGEES